MPWTGVGVNVDEVVTVEGVVPRIVGAVGGGGAVVDVVVVAGRAGVEVVVGCGAGLVVVVVGMGTATAGTYWGRRSGAGRTAR